MPGQEPCSSRDGWDWRGDQRWLGSPQGDQLQGSCTLLLFIFRGRGISERIFVTKGNLGQLQESQIIKRSDLSLLMFPRHSQRVSKCFSAA